MASKSKSRRRVFRASCILAALIVAGSSFAWFSSKDEVTNRLSASANYGVSIVEDFQPPKNFLPGQKVNKDVAVVNTGNVDAFIRAWIDGEMSVIKREANGNGTSVIVDPNATTKVAKTDVYGTGGTKGLTATASTQPKMTDINLNWYDAADNAKYYKELSQKKSKNPENSTTDPDTQAPTTDNQAAYFSEVQSIQAGGVLVSHDTAADYYYVLEQAATITDKDGVTKTYPAGTFVCTEHSQAASQTNKVIIPYSYYGNIDTSEFYPETEGLYLFRRNVKETGVANAADDYEYTGYYFFKATDGTSTTATGDAKDKSDNDKRSGYTPVYLALEYDNEHNNRSDYVLADADVTTNTSDPTKEEVLPVTLNDVRLFTAKEHILKSNTNGNAYTVNGSTATITPLGTPAIVGGTTYYYSYDDGDGNVYYGVTDSGTFGKYDSSGLSVSNSDTVTVEKSEALTWEFGSGADTYAIGSDSATKPTEQGTGINGSANYKWKTTAGGVDYWSQTETGSYYASTCFDSVGALADNTDPKSVTVTTGTPSTGNHVLSATYGNQGDDDYIKIDVELANINNAPDATHAETWSIIKDEGGTDKKWTFYYNNDVEEGATTTKLIDSVKLDEQVTDEAYLAFDFDLNVFMESVQVVLDDTGAEQCEPVVQAWANPSATENNSNTNYVAANGAKGNTATDAEIEYINWTPTT